MRDDLKLLSFPENHGRVEACLNTVVESWDCESFGDYNMEMTLVALVNYAASLDIDDSLLMQAFYINLMNTLLIYRESINEHD